MTASGHRRAPRDHAAVGRRRRLVPADPADQAAAGRGGQPERERLRPRRARRPGRPRRCWCRATPRGRCSRSSTCRSATWWSCRITAAGEGSTESLIAELRPELGVISVGTNTYGHPTPEMLDLLADAGIPCARTDQRGDIAVGCAGTELAVHGLARRHRRYSSLRRNAQAAASTKMTASTRVATSGIASAASRPLSSASLAPSSPAGLRSRSRGKPVMAKMAA